MKEIKTKFAIKDIKALDKAADVSFRAKNVFIRTKEQAEGRQQRDRDSYVEYAEDRIKEGVKTVARKSGQVVGRYSKKAVPIQAKQMILGKSSPGQESERVIRKYTPANELTKKRFAQSKDKARFSQNRMMQAVESNNAQTAQNYVFIPTEKAIWRIATQKVSSAGHNTQQSVRSDGRTIKETANCTIKLAQRSVKTTKYSVKMAIKTPQAAKTATKTAQSVQRARQAAQVSARAGTVSAKTAVKVMTVTIKAIIAAAKGIVALIAAGGWIALVIILVICLAGLLSGSAFGVFLSNESYDPNTPNMSELVSLVNEEFAAEIQRIRDENPHDSLELAGNGSNVLVRSWRDILAVYAVKVAANPENGREVATLDESKAEILREVFWNMNKIDYWLETIDHKDTVTTILYIEVISKSYADMIAEYGFNAQQVKMLNELMQEEYQQLFMRLIGSQADITLSP